MTRHPDDDKPEPPGGRAAERLREFISERYPVEPPGSPLPEDIRQEPEEPEGEEPEGEEGGDKKKTSRRKMKRQNQAPSSKKRQDDAEQSAEQTGGHDPADCAE